VEVRKDMDIKDAVRAALKELIVPDLDKIREGNSEIRVRLDLTNKRLDDINLQLADQSRRIDSVREELTQRIDSVREELTQRIDETNQRIDSVREELTQRIDSVREELTQRIDETNKRIDETNKRIDETNKRIDSVRDELGGKIDKINARMDRLYEVIVRRDEHRQLDRRVVSLEGDVGDLKQRAAV
jgi:hypothetical protein